MASDQQVVIVTGGGSGLGAVIAGAFAERGACVVVADIAAPSAEQVASSLQQRGLCATAVEADVSQAAEVRALAADVLGQHGRVDVLINNAAVAHDDVMAGPEDVWDSDVAGTLRSAYLCSRAVLPAMVERHRGVICNIGSVNAFASYGNEAYSAAKAGLVSLTRALAVRYGPQGIRVNMIAPGTMRTPAWDQREAARPGTLDRLGKWYPLGRIGTPEDVAPSVVFLCSDAASWVTGSVLVVDGGLLAGNPLMIADMLGDDWAAGRGP
ncbi:MAG: SDR family NAD(P)-dependent oxidoreductase [Streptosporangiaceae bacterium]